MTRGIMTKIAIHETTTTDNTTGRHTDGDVCHGRCKNESGALVLLLWLINKRWHEE